MVGRLRGYVDGMEVGMVAAVREKSWWMEGNQSLGEVYSSVEYSISMAIMQQHPFAINRSSMI